MPVYVLHDPYGLAAPMTIPPDYATNSRYAWLAFASGERAAANIAALPTHRVAVAPSHVPARVLSMYANPATHVGA